ncbi:unnamed protein product [Sphagnum balticum]
MKILNTQSVTNDALKIIIAGEPGNGKTTLAKTLQQGLNERVLVISAEAGLLSLKGSDLDYVELQTDDNGKEVSKENRINRLGEIFQWVKQPEQMKKYQWLFLDSLTEIQQNLLEALEVTKDAEGNLTFAGPKNTIKKYGELSTKMMSLCKMFRDLPHYNIVFSALVKNEADNDGISKMKVALIGSFAERLPALFDEVLYLGVTPEQDENGVYKRAILTQKTNKIDFPKDRSGMLSTVEPADLSVIVKKIRGKPVVADISAKAKQAVKEAKEAKEAKQPEAVNA